MTKKDYIIIARVFNTTAKIWTDARARWIEKQKGIIADAEAGRINEKIDGINKILASQGVIVKGLCSELKKDNPKFDAVRFMKACGSQVDGVEFCPNYPDDKVLPDESGLCSLCGEHKASNY